MHGAIGFERVWMERQVAQARGKFSRVLVTWAGDVLELRRQNRLLPTWADAPSCPSDRQGASPIEPMNDAA